ncbi:reverse transcriptase domain-containing protein [Tanacetum coccineum]
MDQMLERLARNKYYCFLDGFSGYFQIPIDPLDQEKTTFTCPYGTFAYRRMPFGLCNHRTFPKVYVQSSRDMIEKTMEVSWIDFLIFGNSFSSCLSHLDKMLQRCEDTNLVLNWEKCHFMVKKGIVLGHKISKSGIKVDKSKVDVIAKLPHPTTVKGIRSFLGMHPKHLETLKMKLPRLQILVAPIGTVPFEIIMMLSDFAVGAWGDAFEKFRHILSCPKQSVYDHSLSNTCLLSRSKAQDCSGGFCCSKNLMSLSVIKKGAENLAADHLSRLENPHQSEIEKKEITKTFPLETLGMVTFRVMIIPMVCRFCKLPCGEFCDQRNVVSAEKKVFQRRQTLLLGRPLSIQDL